VPHRNTSGKKIMDGLIPKSNMLTGGTANSTSTKRLTYDTIKSKGEQQWQKRIHFRAGQCERAAEILMGKGALVVEAHREIGVTEVTFYWLRKG
jgi:hypothetical protein